MLLLRTTVAQFLRIALRNKRHPNPKPRPPPPHTRRCSTPPPPVPPSPPSPRAAPHPYRHDTPPPPALPSPLSPSRHTLLAATCLHHRRPHRRRLLPDSRSPTLHHVGAPSTDPRRRNPCLGTQSTDPRGALNRFPPPEALPSRLTVSITPARPRPILAAARRPSPELNGTEQKHEPSAAMDWEQVVP
uniref:Uncharacterized protein n=1 Tax=Oryza nivara TaxID=4536 RepID=A0A0E0IZS4_ORYNI